MEADRAYGQTTIKTCGARDLSKVKTHKKDRIGRRHARSQANSDSLKTYKQNGDQEPISCHRYGMHDMIGSGLCVDNKSSED